MLILKKFAWGPILKGLEDRENRIKAAIYQAEKDKNEAEKYLAEQRSLIDEAKKESIKILNDSKDMAEQTRNEIMAQAQQQAEQLIDRARAEIGLSKEAAIAEVKNYIVDLAVLAAQKVVGDTLSEQQRANLFQKYINELRQRQ